MHQAVGEFAVVGEEQESRAIEVEASDGDPASRRQAGEHDGPPFRIAAHDEFALRLVIDEDARCPRSGKLDRPAVDGDCLARPGTVAELGEAAAYRDTTGLDPGFDLAA